MSQKKEKISTQKHPEINEYKWEHPKILLMDMKDDSAKILRAEGYNVCECLSGEPYKVEKSDELVPVVSNAVFSSSLNISEKEIVIVDLLADEILPEIGDKKDTTLGQDDWWTSAHSGEVDPRPKFMISQQNKFDIILSHGGIFIVFAEPRLYQDLYWGHIEQYRGFRKFDDIEADNWSFLSLFDKRNVSIESFRGEEIISKIDKKYVFYPLNEGIKDAEIKCTLNVVGGHVKFRGVNLPRAHEARLPFS